MCYSELAQSRLIPIPTTATVDLSAVSLCTPGHPPQNFVEIVAASRLEVWEVTGALFCPNRIVGLGTFLVIPITRNISNLEKFSRLIASDAVDSTISKICRLLPHSTRIIWFGRANQIFCRLGISSNFENYANPLPEGDLFLCPPKDLHIGYTVVTYWSLDPSGAERLSAQDAVDLGFPSLLPSPMLAGRSWVASVYAGLRQFHRAKGFDPDTNDLVWHLDKGTFQLSDATDISAYIDDESYHDDQDDPNVNVTDGELPGITA
ncbi:hypothetical protein C8R45DRAFT_926804 [Mycena sanguinolenta]|nr:hypothetical protein C8R45DRAFT_926804 [Mycena sanguinolenta]